ncbi:MAG: serine O-acetyltransferase [Oscillospiraceae bacterium]|nr:serine O-acetyltransferase [Oscillospiraceae bacterium]
MFSGIKKDINAIRERDPAARTAFEVIILYPGLHAIALHRPAHWLYRNKAYFPARLISQFSRFLTGIEIHPGAKIGRGVLIDHGSGVVIGETAEIGDNCTIYQGVTLGGTGKEKGKRHPTLGNDVLVGSGAKILGPFTIGDGAKVASNAVVLQPLPKGATAVGVPARVVKVNGKRVRDKLDHIHTPDPVSQELCRLQAELGRMKKRLDQLESKDGVGLSSDE